MYKFLIAFVLGMPLVGIWLVEQGEFALSVGLPGEDYGASTAYAAYAAVVVAVALAFGGGYRRLRHRAKGQADPEPAPTPLRHRDREYFHFSKNLLLLNLIFLATMLFGFGGINVWLGSVEKGLFRATLGPLGAVAYWMTKFAIPVLFAYASLLLSACAQSRPARRLWYLNALLVFIAGSTWGFKTTGLFMLLPGLLILNWKLSARKLLWLIAIAIAVLVMFFYWFDAQSMEDVAVIPFLAGRLTIIQGDVAWYVYGLYVNGEPLPNYWPTLLAAVGDTVLSALGVARDNYLEWMSYHYDWMVTYLSGAPIENIANGHSTTATPFAEGIIAGGWWGAMSFAVLAGLLVGRTYYHLDRAIKRGSGVTAAMLSTYFCFHIFSWLNAGAVTQLFHVSVLAYLAATYLLLRSMSRPRRRRAASMPDAGSQLALDLPARP